MLVGMTGLINPWKVHSLPGPSYANRVGLTEIRVLFGRFLVALPGFAIWVGEAHQLMFSGIAAVAAAAIKSIFAAIDKCPLQSI